MVEFVTKAQAQEQLRLDPGADDLWLEFAIPAVSAAVDSWLKSPWRRYELQRDGAGAPIIGADGLPLPVLDDAENPVLAQQVVLATLVELASHYRFREGEGDNTVPIEAGHGYVLSRAATALLAPLRRSTVA
ncbi:hypothetical protein [Stenotrophomonas lactitubi]|uniref:hypothetical protein n=1 Tax=Stenotrophomonas lactitubi TaxID=2045214 RepID=UPI001D2A927C|nr:hypothetical protein [Stenotrophomonas lactitubi]CAH0173966.1 hypothetical protein SRABI81_01292 [Stenotrophomonas lactitubi]CAH0174300.1 hypothetical protein SRABI122_01260 [Stenotrophomonas lactitubi]CAH0192366.1 hypothetical protein SRABI102_01548 [Stenotrophomonas lactitubi]CAH0226850.1 hypothetical protein SRABI66_02587 [Stenotrophomonas lactitubi]